ncbi:ferritin-like domain-containing protein [Thermogemmatispora carboxidivorans]|uniref:ferritin-like domain-containing protein n=1 Tax=Thermogemmatispora carboxidivorans TaxID=1382306 RepID=UPI00069A63A7|nr:ferritin-like domain-containing protein [Thermogemmatispora carboxidivorans]
MDEVREIPMPEPKSGPQQPEAARRALLKGVALGAVAGAGLGTALSTTVSSAFLGQVAHAASSASNSCVTPIKDIFTIARTAERLAVTFYSNGLRRAYRLGLTWREIAALEAALIEEQIHENFFAQAGGDVLTSEFSFPHGEETFESLRLFIETQQQLEGVFDSAFLSAVRELAQQNRPDLAQIAAQIATVEAEHRALGRFIGRLDPADNWAFSPVLVAKVGDAPALVQKAGYLNPRPGNRFVYHPVNTTDRGVTYRTPYAVACS